MSKTSELTMRRAMEAPSIQETWARMTERIAAAHSGRARTRRRWGSLTRDGVSCLRAERAEAHADYAAYESRCEKCRVQWHECGGRA